MTQARARAIWGESKEDIRNWIIGLREEIPEEQVEDIMRQCWHERARAMRRTGWRGILLGLPLLAGGGSVLTYCVLRLNADGTGMELAGAVGAVVTVVYGGRLLLRGAERVAFGAGTEGEVNDTVL